MKTKYLIKTYTLALCFFFILCSFTINSLAVGFWQKGKITRAPWKAQYTYVKVDKVKYTIMKGTTIYKRTKTDGAAMYDPIKLNELHKGDTITLKVEGNRIYNIELIK